MFGMSAWVDQIFEAKQASHGVVRRAVSHVEKGDYLGEIIERAKEKGYHVVETGDQIVILCHEGELRLHC
ncbi:hypothetical protein CH304_00170 [Rhodococcus sp. 15-649-1-2]|nr:hypothetical protein CH304_00170 [Rhodococcus sp. 15-649-1-2]